MITNCRMFFLVMIASIAIQIQPEEQKALAAAFRDDSKLRETGIKLARKKYFYTGKTADGRGLIGRFGVRVALSHSISSLWMPMN